MKTYVILSAVETGNMQRPELEDVENRIFSSINDVRKKLGLGPHDHVLSMLEFMSWRNDYDGQPSDHNPIDIRDQFLGYVRIDTTH